MSSILHDKYKFVRALGQGGTGNAFSTEDAATGQTVAVKKYSVSPTGQEEQAYRKEINMLKVLKHSQIPSIDNFEAVFQLVVNPYLFQSQSF